MTYEAAIQQAIDDQIAVERDAARWRALLTELDRVVGYDTPITPALFEVIKATAGRIRSTPPQPPA